MEKMKSIKVSESLHRLIMMAKIDIQYNTHCVTSIDDVLQIWYDAFVEKYYSKKSVNK